MLQHKQAFTLIEILVVVLIIGILAAVAVPQYRIAVAKTRYTELMAVVDALSKAEEIYYLANGKYTDNMEELDISVNNSVDIKLYIGENGEAAVTGLKDSMMYVVYLQHYTGWRETYYRGKHFCRSYDITDEISKKVCKALSGNICARAGDGSYCQSEFQ
ncbi:MAG: prepilin-type N-terminal cleavage/methylation domain-containing protein [Elusimicrobiaceae bacterium]|nr:prepilin-type N-terminal cleavage/methylation domain-containing protein [Elusimicrobiaceae bacterium]